MMKRRAAAIALGCLLAQCACAGGERSASSSEHSVKLDAAVIRAELEDILSRPEYNRSYAPASDGIRDKIGKAIERALMWVARLLRPETEAGVSRRAAAVLAWLVALGFAALLALIAARLARPGARGSGGIGRTAPPDYDLLTAGPLIHRAARLAEQGDYRGAFRCAYLASIAYLDEVKALRFEHSRTNWEYMRELEASGHHGARKLLEPLTLDFDRVFYGREDCGKQHYLAAAGAYEAIVSSGGAP